MPITVGVDTYVTVAEYDAYLAQSVRAYQIVTSQTTELKEAALVTATRRIEQMRYEGEKTGDPQTLSFPRTGLTDRYGDSVDSGTVPQNVKSAQIEYAFDLTQDISLEQANSANKNFSSLQAGSVSVSYFSPEKFNGRFPPQVQELLKEFLLGGESVAPYVPSADNPDDQEGTFVDRYGLNNPI